MQHLDAERLSLLALGEHAAGPEQSHLDTCDQCALDLAELEYTVAVGRSTAGLGELETPPEVVWDRIAQELELARAPGSAPAPTDAALDHDDPVGGAHSMVPRRRRRAMFALAASVAALGLIGGGTWAALQAQQPTRVAAATLDAFPSHPDAAGEAVVVETSDGARQVRVQLDDSESDEGYKEVWLITGDASALVSLGVMEGAEADFTVPEGLDLSEYVLVDVSLEPDDGDPSHSGNSIVRGELSGA
ncbi:MAG: anti-sigma factor [Salinibacterium sp.]|nr:anti-sigma factor [Salinibacterium sp.]MBF0672699.1 anti-sigma factor [Salinibacterium sp.]